MKKVPTITITEDQLRAALGVSGRSPLADDLVMTLFNPAEKARTLGERVRVLERILILNNNGYFRKIKR